MSQKRIIGRREIISILESAPVSIFTSKSNSSKSLHCDDIFVDDEKFVHFTLLDEIHSAYHGKKMKMPLYKFKRVKSSNGTVQLRASIKVDILFFGKKYKTVISLTDRSDMKYPMLIGRKFLTERFLVDVSKEYLTKAN